MSDINQIVFESIRSANFANKLYQGALKTYHLTYDDIKAGARRFKERNLSAPYVSNAIDSRLFYGDKVGRMAQQIGSRMDYSDPKNAAMIARGERIRDKSAGNSTMTVDPPSEASNQLKQYLTSPTVKDRAFRFASMVKSKLG